MVQKNIEETNTYTVGKIKDTTRKIKILREIITVATKNMNRRYQKCADNYWSYGNFYMMLNEKDPCNKN